MLVGDEVVLDFPGRRLGRGGCLDRGCCLDPEWIERRGRLRCGWVDGWIKGRWWLARDGSRRIPRWEASGWMAGGEDETDGTSLLKIRVGLVYI